MKPAEYSVSLSALALATSLLALSGTACAPRSKTPEAGVEAWRARAMESEDPEVWTTLAAYELLADGGEADAIERTLLRAAQLGGSSLRLQLLAAEAHVLHGNPDAAFDAYQAVLELAAGSQDALAPWAAEMALGAAYDLRETIPDHNVRLRALLDKFPDDGDALGPYVRQAILQLRERLALERGDAKAADAVWEQAGCVQEARVAGPFGPRELLTFDRAVPAEAPGPLADQYDLDPRHLGVQTRALTTRRCVLGLGRNARDPSGGSYIARAEVKVEESGMHVVRVETPNSFVLWVDDQEVARVDRRQLTGAPTAFFEQPLSAGTHTLRVKVTSRHPNPALRLMVTASGAASLRGVALPEPVDPLESYLAAKLALGRGDVVHARELSSVHHQKAPTAATLVLHAAAVLADPLRAGDMRRDAARGALRMAGAQDPKAWYPLLALSNLEAADGRLLESIEGLRAASERWPEVLAIHLSLVQRLAQRGWLEASDQALADAVEAFPHSCTLTEEQLASERRLERAERTAKLTEKVMACDATKTARFVWLKQKGERKRAAEELERLSKLAEIPYGVGAFSTRIDLAALRGQESQVQELRLARAQSFPNQANAVLDAADMTLAVDGEAAARDYLAGALEAEPDALYDLRAAYEALGGQDAFAGLRLDGAEIIASFEPEAEAYTQPQVLVLDYTVVRLMPDGSSMDLTHNILRVQSQEAVDALGEWEPPEGARVLRLSTIKADGRRLEPDLIGGKDSYSLANLSPGDYVEYEFVRAASPALGFPSGYVGDRFYFKSFEVPFHRSELVMVAPKTVELTLESRGNAPTPERSTLGDDQVLRFLAESSAPLEAEPGSVPPKEFLPSVLIGFNADWNDYVQSLNELLADKSPYDPAAEAQVNELLRGHEKAPLQEQVAVLHHWVTEEVAATDDLFGVAPAMWAARTGSRDRVLHYLLGLAGIESELVMVRSKVGDHAEALLPDATTYGFLLLRVQREGEPLWISTSDRGAPVDYLPELVRGEPGLVINAKAEHTKVPDGPADGELRTLELRVTPELDGSGTVHVRETLRGGSAVSWREDLRSIAGAQLEAQFESAYVAQRFAGGQLSALKVEGLDDPNAPLVLDYLVEQSNLARMEGKVLVLGGLFPSSLAARHARMASRTTTQVVGPTDALDMRIDVVVPQGAELQSLPTSMEVEGPGGARFELATAQSDGQVAITRRLRVPFMRVTPEQYDAFATFCRATDLAEGSELRLRIK